MKIKDKDTINKNQFFSICDNCGSITWLDKEGDVNSLEKDGNQLTKRTIAELIEDEENILYGGYPLCINCEKKLSIISFKTIGKRERIEIAKMTDEDRKQWMLNFKGFNELKREDWKEED